MQINPIESYTMIAFDRDGTLIQPRENMGAFPSRFNWEFIPGRREALQGMNRILRTLYIASNQGGVSAGHKSDLELAAEAGFLAALLGQSIRQIYALDEDSAMLIDQAGRIKILDFDEEMHPQLPSLGYRKPHGGMLQYLRGRYRGAGWEFSGLFVGDRPEDEGAAQDAGWEFCWAADFPWASMAKQGSAMDTAIEG